MVYIIFVEMPSRSLRVSYDYIAVFKLDTLRLGPVGAKTVWFHFLKLYRNAQVTFLEKSSKYFELAIPMPD